ncbi:hypothetical protein [Luteimonas sp. A478]
MPVTREIADILCWLQKRWAPVGTLALSLPVIYAYHYAIEENVPLSVVGGSMIAIYPAMLALLTMVALLLLVFSLFPTVLLLTPINKSGYRLIDPMVDPSSKNSQRKELLLRWSASQAFYVIGLGCFAFSLSADLILQSAKVSRIALGGVALAFLVLAIWLPMHTSPERENPDRKASFGFWISALGTAALQFLLAAVIIQSAAQTTFGRSSIIWLLCTSLIFSLLLAIWQLVAAKFFARWNMVQRPLAAACTFTVGLMSLLALFPPAASRLASVALSAPASGGHRNVQPQWTADTPASRSTITCMRILAIDGDHYIARNLDNLEITLFIPRGEVAGLGACTKNSNSASPTLKQAPQASVV